MNAMPSPYAVEQAMSAAQKLISELGPDADDLILRADTLDGATDALELARRIVRAALDAEAMADAAKARMEALASRHDRFKAQADRARTTVKEMLDVLGIPKLLDPEFTASLRAGPPKLLITDEQKLDEEFWRVSKSVDRPLIKAALDAGRRVEGATLSNGSQILSVRTR
jgi:uncharacterized protein YhaN